jgi:hypothetical protein
MARSRPKGQVELPRLQARSPMNALVALIIGGTSNSSHIARLGIVPLAAFLSSDPSALIVSAANVRVKEPAWRSWIRCSTAIRSR